MDGFINLNKPFRWTSHDCVAKVRRILRQRKVGHAGTLDPAATGVLPIALGRATRLLQYLRGDKAYRATVRFGVQTTTDDLEGDTIREQDAAHLSESNIAELLPNFRGTIQQIPPRYSAIQVGGQRLYDLARAGKPVDVPIRTVEIYSICPLAWRPGTHPELDMAIACGSGTYIRAIARDLGDCAGTGATLAALERTESSGFPLTNSITVDGLEQQIQQSKFAPIPPEAALTHLPVVQLEEAIARRWRMGQQISADALPASVLRAMGFGSNQGGEHRTPSVLRVYDEGDRFLGVGEFTSPSPEHDAQLSNTLTRVLRPRMVFLPT